MNKRLSEVLYKIAECAFRTIYRERLVLVGGASLFFKYPKVFENRVTRDLDFDVINLSTDEVKKFVEFHLVTCVNNTVEGVHLTFDSHKFTSGGQLKSKLTVEYAEEKKKIYIDFSPRKMSFNVENVNGVFTTSIVEDLARKCVAATIYEYPHGKNVVDIFMFTGILRFVRSDVILGMLRKAYERINHRDLNLTSDYADLVKEVGRICVDLGISKSPESVIDYVSRFLMGLYRAESTGESIIWNAEAGVWRS